MRCCNRNTLISYEVAAPHWNTEVEFALDVEKMILWSVGHGSEMICLWRDQVSNEKESFRVDRFQTIILAAHGWRYVDCRSCETRK